LYCYSYPNRIGSYVSLEYAFDRVPPLMSAEIFITAHAFDAIKVFPAYLAALSSRNGKQSN